MAKGWFFESRRHKLSALGIKTGRKQLPKKPITLLVGNEQDLFYPKKGKLTAYLLDVPKEVVKSAKKHPKVALFGAVGIPTLLATKSLPPAIIGGTGAVAIASSVEAPFKIAKHKKEAKAIKRFVKKHKRKPTKAELKNILNLKKIKKGIC